MLLFMILSSMLNLFIHNVPLLTLFNTNSILVSYIRPGINLLISLLTEATGLASFCVYSLRLSSCSSGKYAFLEAGGSIDTSMRCIGHCI
jgi:hypothetical protein